MTKQTDLCCKASALKCLEYTQDQDYGPCKYILPFKQLALCWNRFLILSYRELRVAISECQDNSRLDKFVQDVQAEVLKNHLTSKQ